MKNLSILIVDDDESIRKGLVELVGLYIDTIYEASNGEEGFAIYQAKYPNIILTDIDMPKLNGLGLIEKIRAEDKCTKIIVLSAHSDVEYFQQAMPLYLLSYLLKPISAGSLKKELFKAMDEVVQEGIIPLADNYRWDAKQKRLFDGQKGVKLSNYETLFMECLIEAKGEMVPYETIHYHLYDMEEYSKDAITSMVKRLRQKSSKGLIVASYNEGFKIGYD